MNPLVRTLIILCCAAIVAQSFILCAATGWRAFTRFPDPDLAAMHEHDGNLTSLFGNPDSGTQGPRLIPNDFTFGLLPSPALSREALSVTTVAGPALLAGLLALIPTHRAPRSPTKSNPQEPSS